MFILKEVIDKNIPICYYDYIRKIKINEKKKNMGTMDKIGRVTC
jgi:hypothetical protein